jgi:flagellum-specific ATP synthase
MSAYTRSEDLVRIGAYKPGTDGELDQALRTMPAIRRFLEQTSHEKETFENCIERLQALTAQG